ncbi:hypothetical protein [Moorena bouillonii]|nr:hypothetical protein [Moorena bouillonii]
MKQNLSDSYRVFHTYQVHSIFSPFPIPDSRFPIPATLIGA